MTKIALITGSSRGLGKSSGLNLAKKGVDVIVTYHRNAEEAKNVVAESVLARLSLVVGNTFPNSSGSRFDKDSFSGLALTLLVIVHRLLLLLLSI